MMPRPREHLTSLPRALGGAALGLAAALFLLPEDGVGRTGSGTSNLSWFSDTNSRSLRRVEAATRARVSGAREFLLGKRVLKLGIEDVLRLVRARNLTLAQQSHLVDSAGQAVVQNEALLDPSLSFSLGVTHSTSRERKETITRMRQTDGSWKYAVGDEILNQDGTGTGEFVQSGSPLIGTVKPESELCSVAKQITIDGDTSFRDAACNSTLAVTTEDEYASGNSFYFSDSWTSSLGLFKGFDWGSSLSLGLTTNYFPYDLEQYGNGSKDVNVGLGATAMDLGQGEWTSSASASFSTPLPFSKNFGEEASIQSVLLRKSEISRSQAEETRAFQVNSTVQMALNGYWDLVLSLLQVESAIENWSLQNAQKDRASKLYDLQRVTEYDLMQARTNVANAHNQEEITWNSFIIQGNNLAELLDLPADTVIFPVGFTGELAREELPDIRQSLDAAMQDHPLLKVQSLAVDLDEVELKYRERQLLPNVSLNFSYNISEENAVFGYPTFGESMAGLADPDSRNYSVTINFSYPFGNNDVNSRHAQARAAREQALDTLHLARIGITRNVNDAVSNTYSSGNRLNLAGTNLKLARSSHEIALQQWERDKVSAFELLRSQKDLYDARTQYINALVARKKARVDLLAAEGKLATYQADGHGASGGGQ